MTKVEAIKLAIKNAKPEELDKLQEQLFAAMQEEATENATKALQEKQEQELVKAQAAAIAKGAGGPVLQPKIEVGVPDMYKGRRFKFEQDNMVKSQRLSKLGTVKEYFNNEKNAEEYTKAMLDMVDNALANPVTKANYAEGTGAAGGVGVPAPVATVVEGYIRDTSYMWSMVRHFPMTALTQTIPLESTKPSVGVTAEQASATITSGTFGSTVLTAKRIDAYTRLTRELLQDISFPIVNYINEQLLEDLGQKVDSVVLVNAGDIESGIFVKYGYSEVFSSGSTNFSELLEVNIRNIIGKVPQRYQPNLFLTAQSTKWTRFYGLKDSNGLPLFVNTMDGNGKMFGVDIITPTQAPSTNAAGKVMAVYGNFQKGYIIGDRLVNSSLEMNPYTRMQYNEIEMYFAVRLAFNNALSSYWGAIVTAAT